VAIWTADNWTEGVQPFSQPDHDSELTLFESAQLHYRCFTLLVPISRCFVPAGDGRLTPAGFQDLERRAAGVAGFEELETRTLW
jgi:hypothetical protein